MNTMKFISFSSELFYLFKFHFEEKIPDDLKFKNQHKDTTINKT